MASGPVEHCVKSRATWLVSVSGSVPFCCCCSSCGYAAKHKRDSLFEFMPICVNILTSCLPAKQQQQQADLHCISMLASTCFLHPQCQVSRAHGHAILRMFFLQSLFLPLSLSLFDRSSFPTLTPRGDSPPDGGAFAQRRRHLGFNQ